MKSKRKTLKEKKDALRPTMKDWRRIMFSDKESEGVRETQEVLREVRYGGRV